MEANDLKNSKKELRETPEVSGIQESQSSKDEFVNIEKIEETESSQEKTEEIAESSQEETEEIAESPQEETEEIAESPQEETEAIESLQELTSVENSENETELVEVPQGQEQKPEQPETPETIQEEAQKPETELEKSVEDANLVSEPETEKETEPETVPEKETELETKKEAEPETIPEKEAELETIPEKEAEPETEKEAELETVPEKETDYSSYNEVELLNRLRELISDDTNSDVKEIEKIKSLFYKKHVEFAAEEKKRFIEEGGNEQDFVPSNKIYEDDMKSLLKDYRSAKGEVSKQSEEEKEQNFQTKLEIIEEIKSLVHREESINKTFQEFRELQQRWRKVGPVPQSRLKDLWETYHHHVENFYDYIRINKELRDLDLKKNMEAKLNLCQKAEELLEESSVVKAFNILQQYHELWREIGPVPREKKDELWEKFKAITSAINAKHQGYFESKREEQKKNLEIKMTLCAKAEEIAANPPNSVKAWEEKSNELIGIQKQWREIGYIARKENDKAYKQFRVACDTFFNARRDFFNQSKEVQTVNLQLKTEMCEKAEAMKDSTDWKKTTDEFIKIQKQWREVGPVPRRHSDILWKRFRSACDFFFAQKKLSGSSADQEQVNNLNMKKELIEEVKNFKPSGNEDEDLEKLNDFQNRWSEIGFVPFKQKDIIQVEFKQAINVHYDKMKVDDQTRDLITFQNKMSNLSVNDRGFGRMMAERDKYVVRLKQMENDLSLLVNNVGFFANTKNAESLIDDVNRQIKETQAKIEMLKEKIRIIDKMEDEY